MHKFGYYKGEQMTVTYEIDKNLPTQSIRSSAPGPTDGRGEVLTAKTIGDYSIWPCGKNNLDFNECKNLIKGNRLLPSLFEKQVKILYGNGPALYISHREEDGTITRRYINNDKIQKWLDSWRENGLPDSVETYLNKCARSFYYSEGIFTKWRISVGARAGIGSALPVAGLEYVSELRCRMATKRDLGRRTDVEDKDFDFVMVGNWEAGNLRTEHKVYPRLDFKAPTRYNTAISYSKNPNYGEEIYATNVFFAGIKQWLNGSNATPEYINSFLENSLSARHHIVIPDAWFEKSADNLRKIADINDDKKNHGEPESSYITVKVGDKEMEVGTEYHDGLLSQYLKLELENLTNFLSGKGKNQGKVHCTRSFMNSNGDIEEWQIKEIPQKYKEYIDALITYDKRADMVLLSAVGIDSSISNISSDGVISKSGSDTYYNYIVYLLQQHLAEDVITADINYAIRLNFPQEYKEGVRIGFYRPTPQRQQDINPADRLPNQKEV